MKIYGLIGHPLSHSWSAQYFSEKFMKESRFDESYQLFPLQSIREFPLLIRSNPLLCGLNVTIPFKETVMTYLDRIDTTAKKIRAVNTIIIQRNHGQINTIGYNTDAPGFIQSLPQGFNHKNALILGHGGAAKAIAYALEKLGISFLFISRNSSCNLTKSYQDVNDTMIQKHTLIINTTPLGMYPHKGEAPPLPYHLLTPRHFLYDLIYNPEESLFLQHGKAMGATLKNGLEMLKNQADLSDLIFQNI